METDETEINECEYLFVREFSDVDRGTLRLIVDEGVPVLPSRSHFIGETEIKDCTPIRHTQAARSFELIWDWYVAYSVRNESYVEQNPDELFTGKRFRIYSKSHFLDYVARSIFAGPEHPGPMKHYGVCCENHVIDVVSANAPLISKLPTNPAASG
jgi:hypothetical protein